MKISLSKPSDTSGFSLLEMLMVLAIAALLSGILGWGLATLNNSRTSKNIAVALTGMLRTAHWEAMKTGRSQAVTFDLGARSVTSTSEKPPIDIPAKMKIELTIGKELADASGKTEIYFLPDGTSSGGVIVLGNEAKPLLLRINWLTGQTRIDNEQM